MRIFGSQAASLRIYLAITNGKSCKSVNILPQGKSSVKIHRHPFYAFNPNFLKGLKLIPYFFGHFKGTKANCSGGAFTGGEIHFYWWRI